MPANERHIQRKDEASRAASEPAGARQAGFMPDNPAMAAQRKQLRSAFGAAQLKAPEEELQRKAVPNRTGMPDQLKSGMESLSGMDLSDVRVHPNSSAPRQLNALAYAQGNDIHLAPGQEQHMAHEAWHVVQQRQGRVQANTEVGGVAVNDNPGLEQEADVMGSKALAQAKKDDELEG